MFGDLLFGLALGSSIEFSDLLSECENVRDGSQLKSLSYEWEKYVNSYPEGMIYFCDFPEEKDFKKLYLIYEPKYYSGVCKGAFEVLYFSDIEAAKPYDFLDRLVKRYAIKSDGKECKNGYLFLLTDNIPSSDIRYSVEFIFSKKSEVQQRCKFPVGDVQWSIKEVSLGRVHAFDLESGEIFYRLYSEDAGMFCDVGLEKDNGAFKFKNFFTYFN